MPIRVEQVADQPVVVFIFNGLLDAETVRSANEQAAALLEQMGAYYAVLDIRDIEITYGEALALLDNASQSGLIADPRITPLFIGNSVPGDATGGQHRIPIFYSREDADAYIMDMMQRSKT